MGQAEFTRIKQQIVAVVFILVIVFLAYKLLIPYYQYSQFKIEVQKICNWDRENYIDPPPPDVISAQIMRAAVKRNIPVDKRRIRIRIQGKDIRVSFQYIQPVDLIVQSYDWKFEIEEQTEEIY